LASGVAREGIVVNVNSWIEYLGDPLVLVGFGLFVFASAVTIVIKQRSAASSNAKVGIGMLFSLALIVVAGGIWLASNSRVEPSQQLAGNQKGKVEEKSNLSPKPEIITTFSPAGKKNSNIIQQTQGNQSPAIQSTGDVNITFGASE